MALSGGKHYLASKIVALMPPHMHYVEPFAGGLSVLLAKDPEGISEVVNDLDDDLTEFWRVLQVPGFFAEFQRRVEATPFSETMFHEAQEVLAAPDKQALPPYLRAWSFFVLCRQSLAGRMAGFATLSRRRTRRGMNEQASAWLTAVEGLPAVHARLKRVVVLNHEALDVIRQQDGAQTLFYVDAPYPHDTRASIGEYRQFEMTDEQHADLLACLNSIQGKFLLSGYHHLLYDGQASASGWRCHEFQLPNNAASGDSKRRMVECLWANY